MMNQITADSFCIVQESTAHFAMSVILLLAIIGFAMGFNYIFGWSIKLGRKKTTKR